MSDNDDRHTLRAGFQAADRVTIERQAEEIRALREVVDGLLEQFIESFEERELLRETLDLASRWEETLAANRRALQVSVEAYSTEVHMHKMFRNAIDALFAKGFLPYRAEKGGDE